MKSKFLSILIIVSLIISSCNTSHKVVSSSFIQKRKYNKGYHIEWLANKGKSNPSIARKEKLSAKEKVLITQQKSLVGICNPVPEIKDSTIISETLIQQKVDERMMASINNETVITNFPNSFFIQENDSIPKNNGVMNPDKKILSDNSLAGFFLSFSGFLLAFYLVFWGAHLTALITPLSVIVLCLGILGIIFGFIGSNDVKIQPRIYKGGGLSNWGIVLGFIAVLLVALIFLILISAP